MTPEFQRLVDVTKAILVRNDDQPAVARSELLVRALLEQLARDCPYDCDYYFADLLER